MQNQSLVAATVTPVSVYFTKSKTKIDTFVGRWKNMVVIMTTAEPIINGEYNVQLDEMSRKNGYIVREATFTTVTKMSDTLIEKSGADILKAANRGDFFYASLAFGKPSFVKKPKEVDVIDLHTFIAPNKKYWTAIDAAEKCFISDDKELKSFFNPIVSTFETHIELCEPC